MTSDTNFYKQKFARWKKYISPLKIEPAIVLGNKQKKHRGKHFFAWEGRLQYVYFRTVKGD